MVVAYWAYLPEQQSCSCVTWPGKKLQQLQHQQLDVQLQWVVLVGVVGSLKLHVSACGCCWLIKGTSVFLDRQRHVCICAACMLMCWQLAGLRASCCQLTALAQHAQERTHGRSLLGMMLSSAIGVFEVLVDNSSRGLKGATPVICMVLDAWCWLADAWCWLADWCV